MRLPLLVSIVVRPRATTRWILDHRPGRGVIVLVVGAFLSAVVKEFNLEDFEQATSQLGLAALAVLAGAVLFLAPVLCVALFYLLALVAKVTGAWVGGSGNGLAIRTALAWGFAPFIWALLYRIPAVIFWPQAAGIFRDDKSAVTVGGDPEMMINSAMMAAPYQIAILLVLELAVVVWYLVVASQALAEAQGISSWAGLGNLLLAWVIPFVALVIIGVAAALTVWSVR